MWTSAIPRGLSFSKIIGGISKTLQVANQLIPLYQRARPMISNARTAFQVLKEFATPDKKSNNTNVVAEQNNPKNTNTTSNQVTKKASSSSPTFFL